MGLNKSTDLITVNEFHKSFGEKHIHRGVSFNVKKGECLGLVGGSGTGKSVLLRTLIGLERPDMGQVFYDKMPLHDFDEQQFNEVRKKVAYAFQGGALFDSMTVYDNMAYPLREHTELSEKEIEKKIKNLLQDFGLAGNEKTYPAQLSGGMQKRVGLARAIILEPDVILYDEPTAGLDPLNTRNIQDLILRLKTTGVTSILVTHDMPVVHAVCDRIAVLMNGRIEALGTFDEINRDHNDLMSRFAKGELK